MPDLVSALAGMFDGGDMTIFQAKVSAVGTGVVTLSYNGGTFTDVTYMAYGFPNAFGEAGLPVVNDNCYVIGRKDWGLLVLGRAAVGPSRSVSSGQQFSWSPYTLGTYRTDTQAWTVPLNGMLGLQTDDATGLASVLGGYFFRRSDLLGYPTGGTIELAAFEFIYRVESIDFKGLASDYSTMIIGLMSNAAPAGAITMLDTYTYSLSRQIRVGDNGYVPLPLGWASKLLSGEAKGIYLSPENFPPVISGAGGVRLTIL